MNGRVLRLLLASVLLLALAIPALAHHSFAAAFDKDKPITIKGVLTEIRLENPHSWFYVEVRDAGGKVEKWAFEAGTPSGMIRNGFKPSTIKTGTEITATVTVYGWFNSLGRLWKPLDMCTVTSPMAALPTTILGIESVIFEQDRQGGTRTTLELKSPWALLKYGFQMSDTDPRNAGNPVPGPGSPIPLTF